MLTSTTTKVFSISSYTFTTDTDIKNYFSEKKNTIIVGTSQEAIILLNNHFEKLSLTNFPSRRHSYTIDSSSQIVVLFGGTLDYINLYNDCWVFDETNNWQRLNISVSPQARYGHSVVNISEDKFLLFSGLSAQGYLNHTYIFSLSSQTFSLVQPSTSPQARYYHSMCFVPEENKVYLFGGYNQSGVLNDFWFFDINTKTWQLVQNTTPLQARFGYKMVYVPKNKKIYIFAGQKGFSTTDFLSDIWSYDITKREWLQVGYLPNPLSNFAISLFDEINQIIIFGGYNGSKYLNDVLFFNYINSCFL